MNYLRSELLEKLAASYVLGTMSARARRRFSRLLAGSTQAQRAVAAWQEMLAPLHASITPVAPSDAVWRVIRHRTLPAERQAKRSWTRWLQPVFGLALGAVLSVGTLHQHPELAGLAPISTEVAPSYIGIMNDRAEAPVLATSALRYSRKLTLKVLRPIEAPPGKVPVLWALPSNGSAIRVGIVPLKGKATVELSAVAEVVFAKISKLGVSFEDDPNARAPSQEFYLTGSCAKIW